MLADLQHLWSTNAAQPVSWLVLTIGAFLLAERVQRACNGNPLLNPVPVTIVLMACAIELTGTDYAAYFSDVQLIHFLLGPATVALGLPLYRQWARIRQHGPEIAAGLLVGAVTASASAVGIAWVLGATPDVLRSIAPKSVTTAIAIGISDQIGGIASLTAVFVIFTGICGAMLSERLFDWIGVRDWAARGLATGLAGHAIGTSAVLKRNELAGALAGLAIGLTGLLTALLLPAAVSLLG